MGFDIGKAADFAMTAGMVILLVILFTIGKKWYDSPSERPSWLIKILNTANPVSYKKLAGMNIFIDSNVSVTVSPSTLKDCAANCTIASDCLGFVYSNTNCTKVKTDFGKLVMLPDSADTYVKSTKNLPKWGYVQQVDGDDYAFDVNLSGQRLGAVVQSTDPTYLSTTCTQKFTSNCIGFSIGTSNTWLINKTSNVTTTSNVQSYLVSIIPTYSFSNVESF
jgi:hypothetical protein